MRLEFERFDGRSRAVKDIIDKDTGKMVGHIQSRGVGFENDGGIDIWLFDGKYQITAHSYPECFGFVQGVQAVLNHMTAATDHSAAKQSTAA
jgi:hypothetical protein